LNQFFFDAILFLWLDEGMEALNSWEMVPGAVILYCAFVLSFPHLLHFLEIGWV